MLSAPIYFPFTLKTAVLTNKDLPMRVMQDGPYRETFACLHCQMPNSFEMAWYQDGHPLESLYKDHAYISREELLEHKAVQKTYPGEERLGELSLWHVAAGYQAKKCTDCRAWYIIIYGMGEIQPGREMLQISGIWKIVRTDTD